MEFNLTSKKSTHLYERDRLVIYHYEMEFFEYSPVSASSETPVDTDQSFPSGTKVTVILNKNHQFR